MSVGQLVDLAEPAVCSGGREGDRSLPARPGWPSAQKSSTGRPRAPPEPLRLRCLFGRIRRRDTRREGAGLGQVAQFRQGCRVPDAAVTELVVREQGEPAHTTVRGWSR